MNLSPFSTLASFRFGGLGLGVAVAFAAFGCAATSHPEAAAALGAPSSSTALEALIDEPGPVNVETVVGAEWHVPLSGLVNLDAPAAKSAHLTDREEPIHIAFHALHHPTRGTFLIDTGVERALFEDPENAAIRGLVASVMHADDMVRRVDTKTWIERHGGKVAGVFVTHLHLDHVSGMRDVPDGTPVFVGPGETRTKSFENLFVSSTLNRALEGKPPLSVWQFPKGQAQGSAQELDGVLDVFGDGTTWALHVPGHTAGSTAYLVRTPQGPVLFTGDACHTTWGWEHGVEPGTFSADKPESARSLARLRSLVARHPTISVRLGHQGTTDALEARR